MIIKMNFMFMRTSGLHHKRTMVNGINDFDFLTTIVELIKRRQDQDFDC